MKTLTYDPSDDKIIDSTFSRRFVANLIETEYAVGSVSECRLFSKGLNDTYVIATPGKRYMARVYRAKRRSPAAIDFELAALLHLHQRGIPISVPVTRRDGRVSASVAAAEGERRVALFTFAPGTRLPLEPEACRRYGRLAAEVHEAGDSLRDEPRPSPRLDLHHLLDEPMGQLEYDFASTPTDWSLLQEVCARVRSRIADMAPSLDWGFCHGDLHAGNVHQAEGGTLTLFDFDCCGAGWRAYDLAVFLFEEGVRPQKGQDAEWEAFLAGYTARRALGAAELAAIPAFVAARYIWWLSLETTVGEYGGHAWMDAAFRSRHLDTVRNWVDAHLSNQ